MTLTVEADPPSVDVGGRVQLVIEVVAEESVAVGMPEVGETIGPFAVRTASRPPDVPEEGRRRWRHTYEIDTFAID